MAELDLFASPKLADFEQSMAEGRITRMGAETDEAFLAHVMGQVNDQSAVERVADTFKMVYTPFHGTGYRLIPEVLRRLGMKHVLCVPEQMVIDGDFPTVASPNPENPEGFHLAVALADREGADFILGSDPDADRVGLMVRNREGRFVPLSGNQTGVLLLDYLITAKKRASTLPANAAALKTIVTTEMARKVAEVNGVQMFDTFTGFKFMAEKKNALEQSGEGKVLFSYEESYGYMMGDYVRDKDAVTAALVCTEMAAWYYGQGMTLYDAMMGLYEKYGWYGEKTLNLVMPGLDGLKKMATLMQDLRARPLTEIAGTAVVLPEGLQRRHPDRRGRRYREGDGAQGLQRAQVQARRRHRPGGPPLRHRAQGQGLYPGPGRKQGSLRRDGGQVRRLGGDPEALTWPAPPAKLFAGGHFLKKTS